MATGTPGRVVRVRGDTRVSIDDVLVTEAPWEIWLGGTPLAVLMRTPGDDEDLALGFFLTEGIVLHPGEVAQVRRLSSEKAGDRWEVVLAEGVRVDPERFRRNLFASSSCGVCGKASIDAVRVAAAVLPPGPVVPAAVLTGLPATLRSTQAAFAESGAAHAAGAFTAAGRLLAVREDVGRHNAVDKLVGALAVSRWPLGGLVLMVSGRVSFEVVQKAAVAGFPVVCGVSAPSSLAVELAGELGMTVAGFVREDGFNVYSGEDRIS